MITPDVKVPGQGETLGESNGNIAVSTLIGPDATIKWSGKKGEASGEVKYNADMELFPDDEKTGHFFPVAIGEEYYEQQVTISGRSKGDKVITPTQSDPYVILRIENLEAGVMTAKVDGEEIFSIDFSKTKQNPE